MMSIHWLKILYPSSFLFGHALTKVLKKSSTALIDIMTNGPNWAPMISPASPMLFLITSNFKNTSLLPTALMACRFVMWIGQKE